MDCMTSFIDFPITYLTDRIIVVCTAGFLISELVMIQETILACFSLNALNKMLIYSELLTILAVIITAVVVVALIDFLILSECK